MKVIVLPGTRQRLRKIHAFISREKGVITADQVSARLKDRIQQLERVHNYQEEDTLKHLGLGHRSLVEGPFKVIFRLKDDVIFVTDVFHTKRHPSEMKG